MARIAIGPSRMFVAVLGLVLLGQPCRASWIVNGLGLGAVKAEVWCFPNRPPFAPNAANLDAGPLASAFIPGPSGNLGPGGFVARPAGCNPATVAGGVNAVFWGHTSFNVGAGGDTAADGGADLFDYVTPTSELATASVSSLGEVVSANTVRFDIDWFASDPGVAQRIRAFYYDAELVFPPDFDGEITSLPDFDTLGTLLFDTGVRVGPYDESFSFEVTGANVDRILLYGEAIAVSVPEPGSMVLLGLGGTALALGSWRRRVRRA